MANMLSKQANRVPTANRLLAERSVPEDAPGEGRRRPARSVTVNLAESPLGWLKARGLIDARQYEAGERLRGDWTIAGLGPRVTMRWDAGARSTGDGLDPALAQIAAKRRVAEMGENSEKGFWQRWVKQALSLGNDTPNTERAQEKSCFMNTFFWLWRGEFSSSRVRQAPMASIRRLWGKEDSTVLNRRSAP